MRYVEAPHPYRSDAADGPSIFLAGGITDCPDWQADARRLLAGAPVVVLNPRRVRYPGTAEAYEQQVAWEFAHLGPADLVLFWFPAGGAVQPIALFELGALAAEAARGERRLVVGAAAGYVRRHDLTLQLGHRLPGLALHDDLDGTVAAALAELAIPFPTGGSVRRPPGRA